MALYVLSNNSCFLCLSIEKIQGNTGNGPTHNSAHHTSQGGTKTIYISKGKEVCLKAFSKESVSRNNISTCRFHLFIYQELCHNT